MNKKFKKTLIISILLIIYVYILAIDSIPNNITKFEGEELGIPNFLGIKINKKEIEDSVLVATKERKK